MTINYLFIDDDSGNSPESYINSLVSKDATLKITRVKPCGSYDAEIHGILSAYQESLNSFGLILDLRLNQDANDSGIKSDYRGSSLAQEIRTRMTEGGLPRFPIVLWSMDEFIQASYKNDNTSHDLFDCVYVKDKEVQSEPGRVAQELISLVNGYRLISEAKDPKRVGVILDVSDEALDDLDPRILDELTVALDDSVTDASRFILSDLIATESVLVDDNVLAARLGISINNSKDSWIKLLDFLAPYRYTGVFSDGWTRWWLPKIENWWFELTGEFVTLKRVSATNRVNKINEKLSLNLVAEVPMQAGYSENFDTICRVYNKPLDSTDAVRANCPTLKPWQTPFYLSIKAVLDRAHMEKWRVHPLDRSRIEAIKASGS